MRNKVLCVVGPTGAGKTRASLRISREYGCAIINADSRQVYKSFPIITAQPSVSEQETVPHKLYGYLSSSEKISAGSWSEAALREIDDAWKERRLPVVVGGTGMYFRAAFDGIVAIPDIPSDIVENVETRYKNQGLSKLYDKLKEIDPLYARVIHHNDQQRVIRALAVFEATEKPFSWWHKNATLPSIQADVLRVGVRASLSELTPVLIKRIDYMLELGARREVVDAYKQCPDEKAPGWSSIGCAELLGEMQGRYGRDETLSRWIKNTRAYAKRQLTWFNADKRVLWFHSNEMESLRERVDRWLQEA